MEYRKYKYTNLGTFGIELATSFKAIGFGFDFGGGDNDRIMVSLHLLFGIYLSYSHRFISKINRWISTLIGEKYTRSYNSHIHFYHSALSIIIFGDHVGDNALFHKYWDIARTLKGTPALTIETLKEGETEIAMPEKRYPAPYKIQRYTWTYPRWFKKSHVSISFDFPEAIPHEGKGENSWDCGMDGTFGMSLNFTHLRQACDDVILSIIKTRMRHSSLDKYLNLEPMIRKI